MEAANFSANQDPAMKNGFTLIELMITLLIIALMAGMATPGLIDMVVKSDLRSAQDSATQALRKAKSIARTENTNVTVTFTANSNAIELKLPDNTVIQTISMPNNVVASATASYQFKSIGTVNAVGTISLESTHDNSTTKTITINTLFGQISTS